MVPAACQITIEVHLDRCIDALVAGADWRAVIPPTCPHRAELIALMEVGERVREALDSPESWQGVPPSVLRHHPERSPNVRD